MASSTELAHQGANHHGHAAHDADDGNVHVHIAPAPFYWGIFGALVCLTIITVGVSYFDFGNANTFIAIVIATIKAALVATFFMHLRHDKLFHTLAFLSAFLFLSIFLLMTADDLWKRGQVDDAYGTKTFTPTGEIAPGGMPSAAPSPSASNSEHKEERQGPQTPAPGHH